MNHEYDDVDAIELDSNESLDWEDENISSMYNPQSDESFKDN